MYGISVVHGLQIISTKSSNTIVLAKQNTHMMFTVAENAALQLLGMALLSALSCNYSRISHTVVKAS